MVGVRSLLFVVCCVLRGVCRLLHVDKLVVGVCCLLCVVRCSLSAGRCLLSVAGC